MRAGESDPPRIHAALRHLPLKPGVDDLWAGIREALCNQNLALPVEERDAHIRSNGRSVMTILVQNEEARLRAFA